MSISEKISALKARFCPIDQRASWSLNGLDLKLATWINFRNGTFVEAGGNDGVRQSNSLYFERYLGWKGLLVEAVPSLADRCRTNRPHCKIENCALVAADYQEPEIEIHYRDLMSVVPGGLLGDDEERFLRDGTRFLKKDENPCTLKVPARTLSSVLDAHNITSIDLLSLDVEGYEMEVLKGLDLSKHAPKFMLIEVRDRSAMAECLHEHYNQIAILHEGEKTADILYQKYLS